MKKPIKPINNDNDNELLKDETKDDSIRQYDYKGLILKTIWMIIVLCLSMFLFIYLSS